MIIRKRGLWKDQYINVSKEAGEAMVAADPMNYMEVPQQEANRVSIRDAARAALTQKPMNVPETETASLDRQAGQLRAETDRLKAQTNLAKAQNEHDKSLQALQAAQQPPQQQMADPSMGQQASQEAYPGMANVTASDDDIVKRLARKVVERRRNGQFASSAKLMCTGEGKKGLPFQN